MITMASFFKKEYLVFFKSPPISAFNLHWIFIQIFCAII